MADRMGTGHLQKYLNQVQKLHIKIMIYNIIIFKLGIVFNSYQGPLFKKNFHVISFLWFLSFHIAIDQSHSRVYTCIEK